MLIDQMVGLLTVATALWLLVPVLDLDPQPINLACDQPLTIVPRAGSVPRTAYPTFAW